ncbi:CMRF35-like molecule 5 isoform X5 [Carassius gibelio]|uniref:CMRF35-like molecule 5 isoform X5 n=1 Tax=Carassius gibelio TaxID=101364 RepID=UPI00227995B3|nr:CMRF35-like molecule 5 isoform X5 [Carassius gibelio]
MKLTFMISAFLLTVSSSVPVEIIVRGTEGEQVFLNCPYAEGYENSDKYFYKGPYRERKLLLKSAGGQSSVSEGRFSLLDDHQKRSFTLIIRNLSLSDAGVYTCAAGWGTEIKNIQLNVIRAPQKTRPDQISTSTLHSYTHTSTVTPRTGSETTRTMTGSTAVQHDQPNTERTNYTTHDATVPVPVLSFGLSSVAGGLGSVLLVLVLCSGTFLVLKKRKRKSGTALFQQNVQHNTESVHMYEIVNSDPGPSDVITATSSSNQTPASHLNTRPPDSAVYATVTNQQPDSNPFHIHSTNQVTDTDCDYYANMKPPEPTTDNRTDLIYSTVTRPQNIKTNDGSIYSLIKYK